MRLTEDINRIKKMMKLLTEKVENGEVICDNCGWSWKISEGGDDTYICHKCWHDNEPTHLNEEIKSPEAIKLFLKNRPLLDDTLKRFFSLSINDSPKVRSIFINDILGGFDNIIKNNLDFILSKHHIESGGYDFYFKIMKHHINKDLRRIDFWPIVYGTVTLMNFIDQPETLNLEDAIKDENISWEITNEISDAINDYFYEKIYKKTGVVVDIDGFTVGKIK